MKPARALEHDKIASEYASPITFPKSRLSRSIAEAQAVAGNYYQLVDRFKTGFKPTIQIAGPRVVFSRFTASDGSGSEHIWSMDPDGFDQRQLTNSPSQHDETPAISPANGSIVFSRGTGGGGGTLGLWSMNSDGSNQKQITTPSGNQWDTQPAWAPDGKHIVFTRSYQIWTANADGTGAHPVMTYDPPPNPFHLDHAPTYNPQDKTQIAFWREEGGTSRIMKVHISAGSIETNITQPDPNLFDGWPAWSPDGLRIAFWRNDGTQGAIYTISPDGQGLTNVTKPDFAHGVDDRTPCWSPDPAGSEIIFSRTLFVDWDIYKISSDGSGAAVNISKGPVGHTDFYGNWQTYP